MLILLAALPFRAQAQNERKDPLLEMSLADLMNLPVTVASKKALSVRESPGIITVVTREEIHASGARDLVDILRLVPGFEFGVDVEGIVSAGIRGNWANEGKVLLMIDGLELNESSYSTIHLSNRIDLNQVERIEIIRGPGSAIYGRYAELGVINIVMNDRVAVSGIDVEGVYGIFADKFSRRSLSARMGIADSSMRMSFGVFAGTANLSAHPYIDPHGTEIGDAVVYRPFSISLGAVAGRFSTRMFIEQYQVDQRDAFGVVIPSVANDLSTIVASAKYDLEINDDITIVPSLAYKWEAPWHKENPLAASLGLYYSTKIERISGGLIVHYDTTSRVNFLFGLEAYQERSESPKDSAFGIWTNKAAGSLLFKNVAFYGQLYSQNEFANLTLGGRYEMNDRFGSSFAPRIALTKAIDRFHAKALLALAFRSPGIENFRTNASIKPERTSTYELELGYEFSPNLAFRLNGFDIRIINPIIYFRTSSTGFGAYENGGQTGTIGLEGELRYKGAWTTATVTYSFYRATSQAIDNAPIDATGRIVDTAEMLGLPAHKVTASGWANVLKGLTLSPSVCYLSSRYGYDDTGALKQFDRTILLNLYISYGEFLGGRGTIGLGVYNALDAEYAFIQPYNAGHPPLPAPSREFLIKVGYLL